MDKEFLINEIDKLESELENVDRKNYIISTRLKRLMIFLKKDNHIGFTDLLKKLEVYDKDTGYGNSIIFDKDQMISLLNNIKKKLEQNNEII